VKEQNFGDKTCKEKGVPMINKLSIRNFQSHKNSELELDPGVNVIVGESDSGKTAILRALNWLVFGKPSGTSMIRHNVKSSCVVSVELDERLLSKERGDGKNLYRLDDEVYKGFGQSLPEPVTTLLNMNEINFMRQMDPPFLFSKTAGEVAQYLNRLINLDVIDTSLSNIKSFVFRNTASAGVAEQNISRIAEELKQYVWIDEAEKDLAKLEKKELKIDKLKEARQELNIILVQYANSQKKVERFMGARNASKRIEEIEEGLQSIKEDKRTLEIARYALDRAKEAGAALLTVPRMKGVDQAILQIESAQQKLEERRRVGNVLNTALMEYKEKKLKCNKLLVDSKALVVQYKKAMPDICPLCEQSI
jgi:exonuclease SbcC